MSSFLVVGSDSHSSSQAFSKLAYLASDKDCLSLIYCGDIDIDNWEIGEMIRNRNFSFIPVLGNCDSPFSWRDVSLPTPPLFRKTEFFGLRIFITHGHYASRPSDVGLEDSAFDLVISGHTHIPRLEKEGNLVFLNPGSIARPRGYSKETYAKIIFEESALVQILDALEDKVISQMEIPLNK